MDANGSLHIYRINEIDSRLCRQHNIGSTLVQAANLIETGHTEKRDIMASLAVQEKRQEIQFLAPAQVPLEVTDVIMNMSMGVPVIDVTSFELSGDMCGWKRTTTA